MNRRNLTLVPFLLAVLVAWQVLFQQETIWRLGNVVEGRSEPSATFAVDRKLQSNSTASGTNKSKSVSTSLFRPVEFINIDNRTKLSWFYSAMWWQSVDTFLRLNPGKMHWAEGSSFEAFNAAGHENVFMTRDWLDFSVEHMSGYWRHFDAEDTNMEAKDIDTVFEAIEAKMQAYIDRVERYETSATTESQSTIAILTMGSFAARNRWNARMSQVALAATLASMWRIGIPRAILVGLDAKEEQDMKIALDILQEKLNLNQHPMEIKFCLGIEKGLEPLERENKYVVARGAFHGLQLALRGELNETETIRWLGGTSTQSDRWKHVYFTEPDQILNTRPSALEFLSNQLKKGVVVPHRFTLTHHSADFPQSLSYKYPHTLIHNAANAGTSTSNNLSKFEDLDSNNPLHACCDAGVHFPARYTKKCKSRWWACGYSKKPVPGLNYTDPRTVANLHKRLALYPMIRLTQGIGVASVDNHASVCWPIRDGSCDDLPTLPDNNRLWR